MAKDPSVSRADHDSNQNYQRKLAISLISSLGVEGAVHACHANGWDGVLNWVISLGETSEVRTGRA